MHCHMLTNELIRISGEKARCLGHSYVGSIHILLALLEQPGETGTLLRLLGDFGPLTHVEITAIEKDNGKEPVNG